LRIQLADGQESSPLYNHDGADDDLDINDDIDVGAEFGCPHHDYSSCRQVLCELPIFIERNGLIRQLRDFSHPDL